MSKGPWEVRAIVTLLCLEKRGAIPALSRELYTLILDHCRVVCRCAKCTKESDYLKSPEYKSKAVTDIERYLTLRENYPDYVYDGSGPITPDHDHPDAVEAVFLEDDIAAYVLNTTKLMTGDCDALDMLMNSTGYLHRKIDAFKADREVDIMPWKYAINTIPFPECPHSRFGGADHAQVSMRQRPAMTYSSQIDVLMAVFIAKAESEKGEDMCYTCANVPLFCDYCDEWTTVPFQSDYELMGGCITCCGDMITWTPRATLAPSFDDLIQVVCDRGCLTPFKCCALTPHPPRRYAPGQRGRAAYVCEHARDACRELFRGYTELEIDESAD
jgi:hypothetical protein